MKHKFLGIVLAIVMATPVQAATCRELADSYVEWDDSHWYEEEGPQLVNTTAYIHGEICCRGDKARHGIVAGMPECYGMGVYIYEAVPTEEGYKLGEFLGIYECLDTGYGKSTGDGVRSKVRPDKASRGTIEVGQTIDVYQESYEKALKWMKETKGKVFIKYIEGKG